MATEQEHIAHANRTQRTISHLLADRDTHSPWIATTAFYKALHIVEAVFFNDSRVKHTSNHGEREAVLKRNRKYQNICNFYLKLQIISINARYLSNCSDFDSYMSAADVEAKVLRHFLHQVETSAQRFLSKPAALAKISQAT